MMADVFLLIIVISAVVYDLRERRIPNWLIIIGLITALVYYGITGGYEGLLFCLKGFLIGISLLLIPFVMGGIGAGDVKLLGVIGALKGNLFVVNSFLWMALWGGIIAVFILWYRKQLLQTLSRLFKGLILARMGVLKFSDSVSKEEFSIFFPYGVAIALGVITSYFKGWCI